ncbi:TetR/AcrR family transcriptional regulator [Siccirubricoccus phaeus]|uniref:TetR/AcrR family transcriptional regulator n=1 Tax=Siccirubricoccus phaeus TaxID=2595053 RepID=UPI0011F0B32A|nr:TetR/AcrR family transcriptional regulator [Siccirubricoccus phaeus]
MSLAIAHQAGSPDARTRILDAAEAIIRTRGVASLTLDAAAREAGVSKGGLLYHFASKEALLHALLGRMAEWMRQDFAATVDRQPEGPSRVARAMLEWGFGAAPEAVDERCGRAAAVFLACFHHDPALLDPARAVVAGIREAIAGDGLPLGHGQVIMAAADGLFMARIFDLYTPGAAELAAMQATLARLLEPAPPEPTP